MAVSVRMDPLLERALEQAAQRRGISKSQFIIEAVERALGRKNPYELMLKLKAEEAKKGAKLRKAFAGYEIPYDTERSREQLLARLAEKHGVRRDR